MVDEDIEHWYRLIAEHKRHLRVLEEQAAGHGRLNVPPAIALGIDDAQRSIAELEQRVRRRVRNADNGRFFSAEEVEEISEKVARIAELEQTIPVNESALKTQKEAFYNNFQAIEIRIGLFFLGTIFVITIIGGIIILSSIKPDTPWENVLYTGFAVISSIVMPFFVWRRFTKQYLEIKDMEKKIQHYKVELQLAKAELSRIYKVDEEPKVL